MYLNIDRETVQKIQHALNMGNDKELAQSLETAVKESSTTSKRRRYIEAAQSMAVDGELEVDDEALVSEGDDPGAYVMAWLWVDDDKI